MTHCQIGIKYCVIGLKFTKKTNSVIGSSTSFSLIIYKIMTPDKMTLKYHPRELNGTNLQSRIDVYANFNDYL